jgi:UDP-N-acetylglucosamine 2-epimerase
MEGQQTPNSTHEKKKLNILQRRRNITSIKPLQSLDIHNAMISESVVMVKMWVVFL